METNKNNQSAQPTGNIGTAGKQGTQSFNNGNDQQHGNRGGEKSGAFDKEGKTGYEGGELGTAGSGGMDIPSTASATDPGAESNTKVEDQGNANNDVQKVPVPEKKPAYEGGSLGTAGSGGMEMNADESSNEDGNSTEESSSSSGPNEGSRNPHGLGSPPAANIADGSSGGAKQPKEHTGKDTDMGASGGTSGMGHGNNRTTDD